LATKCYLRREDTLIFVDATVSDKNHNATIKGHSISNDENVQENDIYQENVRFLVLSSPNRGKSVKRAKIYICLKLTANENFSS
jgi:hypothetical protein